MSDGMKVSAQQRKQVMEQLWLMYYNDTLFEQGVITESDRNRMKRLIDQHKPSTACGS